MSCLAACLVLGSLAIVDADAVSSHAEQSACAAAAVSDPEEDSAMVQLRGVTGPGVQEGASSARKSTRPFFYPKGQSGPAEHLLVINEDGVNNTYYMPGAPSFEGGTKVKFEPPYRYYLMRSHTDDYSKEENFYQLNLVGKTFTVDIEFGNDGPSCGCNINFYLVDMPWPTPGSSNDYYCDAQCFWDHGCCAEFDINEGNMNVQQVTNHACTHDYQYPDWVCSKGGNPWGKTHWTQFGKHGRSKIDSRKRFTYSTRFEKFGGNLKAVVAISQDDNEVVLSLGPDLQMNAMMAEMEKGMVLVAGYWWSPDMNWLDSEQCGGGRESCNQHPAYISNWRITTNPEPAPTGTGCCWNSCGYCTLDPWCNKNSWQCGQCGGSWC